MPAYMDNNRARGAAVRRMLVTLPFLVLMIFSLLPIGMYGISWLKGKMVWHNDNAIVSLVPTEESVDYSYKKDDTPYSGSFIRPKLLFFIPYGKELQVGDLLPIAYKIDDPAQHIVFIRQECNMLSWFIILFVSGVLYFTLDTIMKKAGHLTE